MLSLGFEFRFLCPKAATLPTQLTLQDPFSVFPNQGSINLAIRRAFAFKSSDTSLIQKMRSCACGNKTRNLNFLNNSGDQEKLDEVNLILSWLHERET